MLRASTTDGKSAPDKNDHGSDASGFVMVENPGTDAAGIESGEGSAALRWQDRIAAARTFMGADKFADARQLLLNALQVKPNDPLCRAMLGHCTAALDSNSLESLPMCEAASREVRSPEILYHLGSVHLLQENRRKAVQVFDEALVLDPRYVPILAVLEKIGRRKPPVFSFLSRDNALNMRLGKLLSRMGKR